mmetsp:Transcript_46772/g.95666  ORF Transcript_46772/g.95666 Transcript_46772/m.95666 type:complete len:183 (-) Transcript_46772:179-727(-)|eukprot:CAMPEP_0181317012 /NCGR_PEP_ID=MMETSP1101-20121128/16202_1 /TAXON_ID=46948 /ORGANISM="Rhodomonas abbreviata, Strain Caron Lab Isolate" /LENGTH=182 /DNA_ID=CAMNT_0023424299 /DNA_START=20 /DNA_END=568 /DNA_ORIENTATION=+
MDRAPACGSKEHGQGSVENARRGMLAFRSSPAMVASKSINAEDDRIMHVRAAIKGKTLEQPTMPSRVAKPGMFKNNMRGMSRSMPAASMAKVVSEMACEKPQTSLDDSSYNAALPGLIDNINEVAHEKPLARNYVEWACRQLRIDPSTTCSRRMSTIDDAEEEELTLEEMLSDVSLQRSRAQ